MRRRSVDALVVGAGPSGLAAASALRRAGAGQVLVVDRDREPGGVPRHTDHTGFGLRDLRRLLSGPRYARRWVEIAERTGAEVLAETSVTGWTGPTAVRATRPDGLWEIEAGAVVLATGCRERPRPARMVPGDRPAGVLTTGALQRLSVLGRLPVGRRAVVVGAEHVSFSALLALAHAGCRPLAMVTEQPRDQTFLPLRLATAGRMRVPVLTRCRVSRIVGRQRVEAVEITDLRDGGIRRLPCDTVVFTGDWIPEHELARLGGIELDAGTLGPRIDAAARTTRAGVFAVGNLVHAAEPADVASRCGTEVAAGVLGHLAGEPWPRAAVPLRPELPLVWVSPNAVPPGTADVPHRRLLLRTGAFTGPGEVVVEQGGQRLASFRLRRLVPARSIRVPAGWAARVDPAGPPVVVGLRT